MATLVSEIIQQAFEDLAVVQVGEAISTALQTSGFIRLNQMLASLSAEGATVFTQVLQTFALSSATTNYTVGPTGSLVTAKRAQKITSWKATSGAFVSGGPVLDITSFDATAQALYLKFSEAVLPFYVLPSVIFTGSQCPLALGADSAYPLINLRVYPATSALLELGYWTPVDQFTGVGQTVDLPSGWVDMLHWNLAVELFPQYERVGGLSPALAAKAQDSKAVLIMQNASNSQPAAQVAA